jgi:hypothetical protein
MSSKFNGNFKNLKKWEKLQWRNVLLLLSALGKCQKPINNVRVRPT